MSSAQACLISSWTFPRMTATTPTCIQQKKWIHRTDWNSRKCRIQLRRFERASNQMLIQNWLHQQDLAQSQALAAPLWTSNSPMGSLVSSLKLSDLPARKAAASPLFKREERRPSSSHHTQLVLTRRLASNRRTSWSLAGFRRLNSTPRGQTWCLLVKNVPILPQLRKINTSKS